MPYPERPEPYSIVVVGKKRDIQTLRNWARLEILADPSEEVKEFLFEVYKKLGEVQ